MAGFSSTGDIRSLNLGKALSKYVDRITDGLCLRQGEKRQGALTWWVEVLNSEVREVREFVSNVSNENIKKISIITKEKHLTNLTNLTIISPTVDIS